MDFVLTVDHSLRVTWINKTSPGVSREWVIGLHPWDLVPVASIEKTRSDYSRQLREQTVRIDNSIAWVSPIDRNVRYCYHVRSHYLGHRDVAILIQSKELPYEVSKLTRRQLSVLRLFGFGYSVDEIADQLSVAPPTAHSHIRNIMERMGMTREEVRAFAGSYATDIDADFLQHV